jgi:uncharacterized heparinase superfamily protein
MHLSAQWRRLRAKPVRELAGRAAAVVSERLERRQHQRGALAPPDRLEQALGVASLDVEQLLAARRASRPPFFPSLTQRDRVREVIGRRYPDELALTRAWADRAGRGEFEFFGRTHQYGDAIPWQDDPVSRRPWPRRFFGDVKGEGADAEYGDVKDVWELSRQQYVVDLGKSFFLDGRPEHAAEARRLVTSWIAGNPYATGVNWSSPLEPAYRSFAWLWAYYLTIEDPAFSAADHATWLRGFLDSGRFLHRHLELYASPYNHLIGEATALYLLGLLFPEFSEAHAWRTRARRVLIERLPHQFYADGGSVEQATLYHHATLGFYLLAALVGRANQDDLPGDVWSAIERAIEFSMLLVQPDGQLPTIGDTDDARPIQLERRPFFDFRWVQAAGAVLFGRQDFKAVAGRFHEDALWLLGLDGIEVFDRLAAAVPARTSVSLRESGYSIYRTDWTPAADYVCFDCGPQAGGLRTDDVPSAAHGHADCLSVVVFLAGKPVLIDSGFYTYNGAVAWQSHFRKTAAHNTARIDSLDQARHHAKMVWSHVPTARLEQGVDDGPCLVGSHDGFVARAGVRHRRSVWYRREGRYVVLFDEFEGAGQHRVEVNFHLAPGSARLTRDGVSVGADVAVHWGASFQVEPELECGGEGPESGWWAPSLGVKVAAPVARVRGALDGSGGGLLTVIAPSTVRVSRGQRADAIEFTVEGEAWADAITTDGGLSIASLRPKPESPPCEYASAEDR